MSVKKALQAAVDLVAGFVLSEIGIVLPWRVRNVFVRVWRMYDGSGNRIEGIGGNRLHNETVLFLCLGNICRSPMAEGFLKKMLSEKSGKPARIKVFSAGVDAVGGSPTTEAREVMIERGIDISGFRSRQLTRESIEKMDLILTMEKRFKDMILSWSPESKRKVFTLKEFAGEIDDLDIHDPYRKSIKVYETCAKEIESTLTRAFEKLVTYVSGDAHRLRRQMPTKNRKYED